MKWRCGFFKGRSNAWINMVTAPLASKGAPPCYAMVGGLFLAPLTYMVMPVSQFQYLIETSIAIGIVSLELVKRVGFCCLAHSISPFYVPKLANYAILVKRG